MGKKYVIELEEPKDYGNGEGVYYPVTKIPWWSISARNVAKMEPLDDALKEAEQRGVEKAWSLAKGISMCIEDGGMSRNELGECFNDYSTASIFKNLSYAEASEMYEAWQKKEQEEELHPGDIVYNTNSYNNAIVLHVLKDMDIASVLEYGTYMTEGIMIHTPPLAALKKVKSGAVNFCELLRKESDG